MSYGTNACTNARLDHNNAQQARNAAAWSTFRSHCR